MLGFGLQFETPLPDRRALHLLAAVLRLGPILFDETIVGRVRSKWCSSHGVFFVVRVCPCPPFAFDMGQILGRDIAYRNNLNPSLYGAVRTRMTRH